MPILICLLSFIAIPYSIHLLDFFSAQSLPLHNFCLQAFDGSAHYLSSSALFCGEKVTDPQEKALLVNAGLYHLVVIAGFHLNLIERILNQALPPKLKLLSPLLLFGFCLMSSWQAPVVRAFLSSLSAKFGHPPRVRAVEAWLFCIALHPQWIHSLSLHLSVAASLALVPRPPGNSSWTRGFLVSSLTGPLLIGWAPVNFAVSAVAVLLMPMTLLLLALTAFFEISNPDGWAFWNFGLSLWNRFLREVGAWQWPLEKLNLHTSQWAWAYCLILFIALQVVETKRARR